jgi:hypothetical protein
MDGVDDLIAWFTARQHGAVARWQVDEHLMAQHLWDARVASGVLVAMYDGVYRLRGAPFTQDLRWTGAVLAGGPTARLTHLAGAAFHELDVKKSRPQITVAYDVVRSIPGVDVFRTRRDGDVITVRGIRVTTKARTVLDCATVLPFDRYEAFVQDAVTSGRVKIETLLAILDRRGGRGVDGTVALRTALEGGLVDEKIQKKLELLVARIVRRANVPSPDRQFELVCADGRVVFLDNAWPDRKIAVEPAGERWHGSAHRAARTRARARSITATGWSLYEYGWSDATETPDRTQRELESLFCEGSTGRAGVDPSQNGERDEERSGAAA